jgi:hypothetical protein
MSTRLVGAIDPGGPGHTAIHYAVAVTYRIQTGWVNKIAVSCKMCGEDLERGEGLAVVVTSFNGQHPSTPFFCPDCVAWVRESLNLVLERQAADAKKEN